MDYKLRKILLSEPDQYHAFIGNVCLHFFVYRGMEDDLYDMVIFVTSLDEKSDPVQLDCSKLHQDRRRRNHKKKPPFFFLLRISYENETTEVKRFNLSKFSKVKN